MSKIVGLGFRLLLVASLVISGWAGLLVPAAAAATTFAKIAASEGNMTNAVSIVYGNGRFVAINSKEALVSTDGRRWALFALPGDSTKLMSQVTYGNNVFVAVGTLGDSQAMLFSSEDGQTWTQHTAPSSNRFDSVEFINGAFYAVGRKSDGNGVIYRSATGTSGWTEWSTIYSIWAGNQFTLSGIGYIDNKYVVGTNLFSTVYYSTDGATWNKVEVDSAPLGVYKFQTFNNKLYFILTGVGRYSSSNGITFFKDNDSYLYAGMIQDGTSYVQADNTSVRESTDLSTWTTKTNSLSGVQGLATNGNGTYVLATGSGMMVSTDKTNWEYTTANLTGIAAGANGELVAVGNPSNASAKGQLFRSADGGATWSNATPAGLAKGMQGIAFVNGGFRATGSSGTVLSSADGLTWIEGTASVAEQLNGIAYGNGVYAAGGISSRIVTSTDGAVWTSRYKDTGSPAPIIQGMFYVNGKFIAPASRGVIHTSTDGTTWDTYNANDTTITLRAAAYGNGKYVAVGFKSSIGVVLTSADGAAWTPSAQTPAAGLRGVAFANGVFVAVGNNGYVYVSTDGGNWTEYTSEDTGITSLLLSVTYAGGNFYAVGSNYAKLKFTASANSATPVALQSAVADGAAGATTSTKIDLTFDTPITGLTDSDVTITDGAGAAVKGSLTGSGTSWSVALTSVLTEGDVSVAVAAPSGYTLSGSPKTVAVYKVAALPKQPVAISGQEVDSINNQAAGAAVLSNGNRAVLYLRQNSGNQADLAYGNMAVVRLYDSSGKLIKTLDVGETANDGDSVDRAAIAPLKNGGFVVVWAMFADGWLDATPFYEIYNNDGTPADGDPIGQRHHVIHADYTTYFTGLDVIGLDDGGFATVFLTTTTEQQHLLSVFSVSGGMATKVRDTLVGDSQNFVPTEEGNRKIFFTNPAPQLLQLTDGSLILSDSTYIHTGNDTPVGYWMFKFTSDGVPANFANGYPHQRVNMPISSAIHMPGQSINLDNGNFMILFYETKLSGSGNWKHYIFKPDGTLVSADTVGSTGTNGSFSYEDRISVTRSGSRYYAAFRSSTDNGLSIAQFSTADGSQIGSVVSAGLPLPEAGRYLRNPQLMSDGNGGWDMAYDDVLFDGDNYIFTATTYQAGIGDKPDGGISADVTVGFDTTGSSWGTSSAVSVTDLHSTSIIEDKFWFNYSMPQYNVHISGASDAGQNGTPAIALGGSSSGEALVITQEEGKTFGFAGFYLDNSGQDLGAWTVTGKRDGVMIGSQTISAASTGDIVMGPNTNNTTLGHVDTIVIEAPATGFNGAFLDAFKFRVPVEAVNTKFTVSTTKDSGIGSLRWAIEQAGAVAGGEVDFDPSLAGQTIALGSDLTGWDSITRKATTIGDASTNGFKLTGLKNADGLPDITVDGQGHMGIVASGAGVFEMSDIKLTGFRISDSSGAFDTLGSAVTASGGYHTINMTNVVFESNSMTYKAIGAIASLSAPTAPYEVHIDRVVFADNELTASEADANTSQAVLYFNNYATGEIGNSLFNGNSASSSSSGDSYGVSIGGGFDLDLSIWNNTFYNNSVTNSGTGSSNGPAGFVFPFASGSSSLDIFNNLMIDNKTQGSHVTALSDLFYNFNDDAVITTGNNVSTGSPFVNAAGGDFRLAGTATSAIDQGSNTKVVGTYDLAGKARTVNGTVDIGAYEYVPGPASSDAGLTRVAGETDASPAGGDGGTSGTAITWTVNVASSVNGLGLADIVTAEANATAELFSGSDYSTGAVTGGSTLPLTEGGATTAYIKVTAQDGTTLKYYAVTVNRAANAAPAYTVNGTSYPWQEATLSADGDVLAITTNDAPNVPVRVHVTAPEGATVTVKGKPGQTYDNVYIEVDNHITLNIEDLNIAAPAGDQFNGISFMKENSAKDTLINVTGDSTVAGFDGIRSRTNHQLTIKGSGTLTARGRSALTAGADSGHGIHLLSDSTGVTQPGAKLIVEGNVKAYGGESLAESGGSGIFLDWGNMLVKSGSVTAVGGHTAGDRSAYASSGSVVTKRGGYGINLRGWGFPQPAGVLTVEGGQVTATGGDAQAAAPNGYAFEGGRGILADTSIGISGGSVVSTGGQSALEKGGDGMFAESLTITGTGTTVMSTGGRSGRLDAGIGLFITNDMTIDAAAVTATGGEGNANEYGIFSPSGKLTIQNGAVVTAAGGNGTIAGSSGGSGVYVSGAILITGSEMSAVGGNGQVNGQHGMLSLTGDITLENGAKVTAIGGSGASGVGGAGLRAFGNGSGKTVTITADTGDIYIRGGQGALEQRPAILAKDVYIAAGNVGTIAMEGAGSPRSIKNKAGGDDVFKLEATTQPAAATVIFSQVEGTLGGNYTYKAPTKSDGQAYMWLPSGNQTLSATGYRSENKAVTTDDAAAVILPLPSPVAHLEHNGTTTDYTTIQAAIDAAADGDTVTIEAGTHREQLNITKNITLQGAGIDQTIIQSPDANQLAASSWKNLKSQWIYAIIGVKTGSSGEVVIQNLTIDGRKQGYMAAYNGDESTYTFTGIAVRDTSATIDQVKIADVRDMYSDYASSVAPLPGDYMPQDQPSGANHNESILLEGAAGTGAHKVTIMNSDIIKFHKTGILAWGPALDVDIHDNTIQGHGNTLYSTGNGIQIASSDRSSLGGDNGDRRGTTGVIRNNQITDIGLVIPEPGQPGSYLNLGLYGPSGILLYAAGDDFVIEGNTITGPSVYPWHNSNTSHDGGYSNDGIGLSYSKDVVIKNNVVTGFGTGILEGGAVPGSVHDIDGNTLSANLIDIWTLSGDDSIKLGAGAETIGYNRTGNGIDTITGFGSGDRINVIGFAAGSVNGRIGTLANAAYVTDTGGNQVINGYSDGQPVVDFTGGTVTSGAGTTVAARSVQVAVSGSVTTLYIDTENDDDAPELEIKLSGVYAPGNFRLNGGYIDYVPNSTSDVTTVTFDKNTTDTSAGHYADVVVNLTLNGNTLTDVLLNGVSIGGASYTVDNAGKVTIKKEYLAGLAVDTHVFTLDMSGGVDLQLTVTVSDTSPTPETTPAAVIDYAAEQLTGLVANGEYTINGATVTADANGKLAIDSGWLGQPLLSIVKKGNGTTTSDSASQALNVPTRPATPTGVGATNETYPSAGDGTLTGVNPALEYKQGTAGAWTSIVGVAVTGLGADTYYVRTKATATAFASESVSVTVGSTSATAETTPAAVIDYAAEQLTGLVANGEYTINGATVTADANGKLAIDSSWLSQPLAIVKKGNGTTTSDSASQALNVPTRPATPTGVGATNETYPSAGDGTLTGVNSALEYKQGTAGAWTSIAGVAVTGLGPDTYYVRTKATATAFASEAVSVTVGSTSATAETTPAAVIDYAAEQLTGLVAYGEYTINGATVTADANGKLANDSSWLGQPLAIVKKGNGTTTSDSASQALNVPTRPATPTGVGATNETYPSAGDGTLTGVNSALEYKQGTAGAWTSIAGVAVTGLGPDTYYVRTKATATAFASEAVSVTVGSTSATAETTPAAVIDYAAEQLTGLIANGEYTINGATVTADANGKLAIDSGWLGQLLLSIVKKGNGTTTSDSASQALNVPTRPATPTGVGATNETYPSAGDGTLTGVNPALEYKQGTAGAWTSIAGVAVTGLGPDTYYVRTKATATAFASAEAAVTVAAGMTPLTYTIAPIGNETLAALMQGYAPGSQEMKTLTITRTGTGDLTNVRVELGGANAADFELTQPGTTTLNGSIPATTFTVRAKDGLTAGVYTATVTVKANLMADVTFTVSQVVIPPVPSNSTLDVTTVAFDRNTANTNAGHYADAAVNLTLNGNELRGLLLNGTTVTSSVYSLDHTGKLTIYKEFLATLEPGPQVFTLDMSGGIDPTLTVIVTDSTPGNSTVDSVTATFDRNTSNTNAGHYADVEVNLQLNGNTLLGLMLNGNTVTSSVYALDAAGKLTIYKEFLLTLEPGTQVFTLDMSGGVDPTLTVTINDSTPQNSTLDVTAGTFDRNTSNTSAGHYADITVSLTLNGNTLLGVLLNGAGIGGESYSLDGSGKLTIKKEFLAKLGKGSHTFTLDMSAGADPTFTVTVTDSTPAEDPQDTSTSGQPSSGGVSPAPQISVDVYVNGKAESAGTAELEQVNGQSVTTIKVDPQKLEAKLEAEGPGALVTVVIGQESDVVVGSLNGEMIGKMERKQGVLRLQTPGASYSIPASEINIEALAERLGAASKLQDVEVQIRIAEPGAEKSAQVRKSAADEGFTVIAPPLDFVITVRSNDETIELKDFNLYVERTIGLPEGVDPSRITTGIVIENDGSVRHVPTQVIKSDGKYYAKINSLTNSTYSVIWHPVEFADVAEHWGRTAVNDMGSRMVVEGVGDHLFQPDKNITRAEFASILARGLGLRVAAGAAAASYEDVKPGDWFSGAVIAASKLRLIAGYEDGTFRPQEKITRQEVMTMLARAMAVTGLKEKLSQPAALIEGYEDQADIADWAVDSVRASVQAGIVSGRSGTLLAPQAYMTKAEVAAVMQRLLRKSELID